MAEAMQDKPPPAFTGATAVSTAGPDCPLPDNTAQMDDFPTASEVGTDLDDKQLTGLLNSGRPVPPKPLAVFEIIERHR
jgi:hypothetical protein